MNELINVQGLDFFQLHLLSFLTCLLTSTAMTLTYNLLRFGIVGYGALIAFNKYKVSASMGMAPMQYVNAGNLNWNDVTFRFDTFEPGNERYIELNGKVLFYSGSKRIKVSDSTEHQTGCHDFKIRLDHGSFNKTYFGIFCKEDDTKYFCKSSGGIYQNKTKMMDTRRWRIGETIEMKLDCDENRVSFGIESDKMDTIEIDPHRTYHVFVSAKAQPDKGWASGVTIL